MTQSVAIVPKIYVQKKMETTDGLLQSPRPPDELDLGQSYGHSATPPILGPPNLTLPGSRCDWP